MRRVAPSVIAREQLQRLFDDGVDHERNVVSALVETVTRLVVQELLEGEQGEFLGGRGRYERRGEDQVGSRNGYERGRLRTAEGFVDVAVPQELTTPMPNMRSDGSRAGRDSAATVRLVMNAILRFGVVGQIEIIVQVFRVDADPC
jgi:Transposase, Mutator family